MERRWRERCGRRSPQPPQPPAGPAPLYARRSLSARGGRGALGAAAGAGKGRDAPGLGAFGGARAGPRRRGGARAERGQRGPSGAPCAHFHSAMPLCPLRRSHGGTQGFQPSRMFIIAPVRVLGCQGWRVLCVRRHSGLQTQAPQSASLCTCNACLFRSY